MKSWKPWGGHHLIPAIPIFAVLYLLPPLVSIPLAHAMIWFSREWGEATQRAGGSAKALKRWRDVKSAKRPEGIWEHWDYATPGLAGAIIGALI